MTCDFWESDGADTAWEYAIPTPPLRPLRCKLTPIAITVSVNVIMESSFDSREAEKYLSRHLEKPVPFQRYAAVKAIILYWEDSDGFEEYAKEADELKDFFQGLQFDTELCKIPVLCGQDSELELHSFILEKQKQLRRRMRDLDEAPCLLIVHYGGHGDKDDDKHATGIGGPQERRSVWRA